MFALVLVLATLLFAEGLIFWQSRQERKLAARLVEANWVTVREMKELALTVLKLAEQMTKPVVSVDTSLLVDQDKQYRKQAYNLAVGEGYVSASMLRAGLGVGYGRAKRMVKWLEDNEIVDKTADHLGKRPVLAGHSVSSEAFQ